MLVFNDVYNINDEQQYGTPFKFMNTGLQLRTLNFFGDLGFGTFGLEFM